LHAYALERWEVVLQLLALCNADTLAAVSDDVQSVLISAGYLQRPAERTAPFEITSTGFHFLLMDRRRQVRAVFTCPGCLHVYSCGHSYWLIWSAHAMMEPTEYVCLPFFVDCYWRPPSLFRS
jgi:hypothetical protein